MYPVFMVNGAAGSGKDTVADLLIHHSDYRFKKLSLANPMKVFLFQLNNRGIRVDYDWLWGDSDLRETVIPATTKEIGEAAIRIVQDYQKNKKESSGKYMDMLRPFNDIYLSEIVAWVHNHISNRETVTVRHVLQTLGTECGRRYRPDIWVDFCLKLANRILTNNIDVDNLGLTTPNAKINGIVISDARFKNEFCALKRRSGCLIKVVSEGGPNKDAAVNAHSSERDVLEIPDWWYDYKLVNIFGQKDGLIEKVRNMYDHITYGPKRF